MTARLDNIAAAASLARDWKEVRDIRIRRALAAGCDAVEVREASGLDAVDFAKIASNGRNAAFLGAPVCTESVR